MKSLCVLLLISAAALAQSAAPPKSETQVAFDNLKTLAGEWEGPVTLDPPMNGVSMADIHVALRVTSRGNAIIHELQEQGMPFWNRSAEQSAKFDHPVTMLYLDNGELNLVHYCDAGNRPHMVGTPSPDGRKVAFSMVDISGNPKRGHMHDSAFTLGDANHHTEDWIFMLPGDKPMHAHFDLHRVN